MLLKCFGIELFGSDYFSFCPKTEPGFLQSFLLSNILGASWVNSSSPVVSSEINSCKDRLLFLFDVINWSLTKDRGPFFSEVIFSSGITTKDTS